MYREYGSVFAVLVALQVVSYGYLFTTLIFTSHTFPQSWVFPFPTPQATGLGRWFGDLVMWFQGAMEYGPRALGHRSVLARPDRAELRDRLNLVL